MISTGQISQMIAQQNQAFAGNAMYSQQISQQMPGMYSGMFGMPMSGGAGFAYGGQQPLGYDIGSRASGGIMSAMGGAAHFALGAGTLMAGLGMGGASRYALDPFAGAGAMYRAGGAMGMGMGGRLAMGAMGMLPAAGIVAGAGHIIGSVMSGAQEQAGIERTLGSNFNFTNPSTGGKGFNRQQAMAIGDMVRQMDHMPEMMTSMGELTRIMDKVSQMGVMNGITNVRDFGQKFKQTLHTLRDLSKVIGSTMEEALPIFQNIRQSGMYSQTDVTQSAVQGQILGGMTGMNQAQVAQVRSMGSQMGFATGGSRKTGAQHAMRMAGQLGMANQMGVLSNNQIMEMTGLEGAEGIQALSGELTQASYRMSQSALGTAMSIAMAEQKGGKFTGQMDTGLMERFRRGEISKSEMLGMVHSKTGSRGSKMSYVANKNRLRSEMAGQMGVEGQMSMLQMVLGERGYDNPDALNIVSQGFGLDEKEAGLLVDLGKQMPDINLEMKQRGRSEAKRIASEAFMKQNYSWDAIKTKVSKKIEGVVTEPFKKFGAELRNSINQTVDDFVDDVTGRYKVEVTQGMSSLVRGAASGLGDSRSRLASMLSGTTGSQFHGAMNRGVNMSAGLAGSAINYITGNQTTGEQMVDIMRDSSVGRANLKSVYGSGGDLTAAGYNTLDTSGSNLGFAFGVSGPKRSYMATSGGIQATRDSLLALAQGNIGAGSSARAAMGDMRLSQAQADLVNQLTLGGGRGDTFGKLASQYGGMDITGAIGANLQKQGYSGYAAEARDKLMQAAGIMVGPDKGIATAEQIKQSERRMAGMFGHEGSEDVMGFMKATQGTAGGQYIMNAYLTGAGSGSQGQKSGFFGSIVSGSKNLIGNLGGGGGMNWGNVMNKGIGLEMRALVQREMAGEQLSPEERSLTKANKDLYEATKARLDIGDVISAAKHGQTLNSRQKEVLKKMGYSPEEFTKEKAEELEKVTSLLDKTALSPEDKKFMADYQGKMGVAAFTEMAQRFTSAGEGVVGRAAALRGSGVKLGKAGDAMLGRIEAYGNRMKGMGTDEGFRSGLGIGKEKTSFTQDMGEIAYDLTNMDASTARTLAGTDENLEAAYSRASYAKKRLSRNKSFDAFFDKEAVGHMSVSDQGRIGEIRKQYFDEKGNVKDAATFTKFLAGDEGSKLLTAAGAEQRSKYASQADIAKNMESFGQSVTSLAQIVQQMKDGKQNGGKPNP